MGGNYRDKYICLLPNKLKQLKQALNLVGPENVNVRQVYLLVE